MPWIIVAIGVLALLLGAAAIYVRRTRQGARPTESRFAYGLVIGMVVALAIAIPLSEVGGYHEAMSYAVWAGMAGGSIIGFLLDRRHRRRDA